jgi:hypothetical protein
MPKPTSAPASLPDFLAVSPNGAAVPPALDDGPDPFDPERLRLPQDFGVALGVKKALLTIPVRRPAREWFIRVHPHPDYHLHTAVIELKEVGEMYLVAQALWPDLAGESTFTSKRLFLTINRQQVLFFWPVRLPGADGRVDTWSKSALEAAQMAMHQWIRVTPDQSLGAYNVFYAEHALDPSWPDLTMRELLRIAFRDRYIDTLDHPILRQLRGEV